MRTGHNPLIAVEKAHFLGKAGFVRQGRVEARTHVTAGQAAAVSVIGDAEVMDGPYRPSVMQLERQVRPQAYGTVRGGYIARRRIRVTDS